MYPGTHSIDPWDSVFVEALCVDYDGYGSTAEAFWWNRCGIAGGILTTMLVGSYIRDYSKLS